jgi:hypothetical protein
MTFPICNEPINPSSAGKMCAVLSLPARRCVHEGRVRAEHVARIEQREIRGRPRGRSRISFHSIRATLAADAPFADRATRSPQKASRLAHAVRYEEPALVPGKALLPSFGVARLELRAVLTPLVQHLVEALLGRRHFRRLGRAGSVTRSLRLGLRTRDCDQQSQCSGNENTGPSHERIPLADPWSFICSRDDLQMNPRRPGHGCGGEPSVSAIFRRQTRKSKCNLPGVALPRYTGGDNR